MTEIPLFPTPATITNIGRSFTKDEMRCISLVPMEKDEKIRMQNHRSKDGYLFDNDFVNEGLKDIKNFCEQQLKNYLEEIEGVDTDLAGVRITQSWLNKNKPSEHHPPHFHLNSYLSGVLYFKCLPNDHININKTHRSYNNIEFPLKKITIWNATSISQNVTEGDLIIFPSWIMHYVDVNDTEDKERISLAFNTFPIGEMGNYNGATHLKL
tara:strand:+ start:68 stop:700 length:633 start_codon:yes stop_codon:yes gene_type:complete